MRTLLIGALVATVAGCSCFPPPQAGMEACADASGFACLDRSAASEPIEPKPASFNARPTTRKLKSAVARTEKPSSADISDRATRPDAKNAESTTIAAKAEAAASSPPAEKPDPVIIKAKTTIAARLENPASAEFGEMHRVIRKNTLGQSVDTICGRVKGKNASGEVTADRPFLYLVKDDEAYVVDGPAGSAAASAYRNICS